VRNRALGIATVVAALVIGGEPVQADSLAREKIAAESVPDESAFQVAVVRGSTVSLVTGAENGEISEVTIREDPRPARSETRKDSESSPPRLVETERAMSTAYYVFIDDDRRRDPTSFVSFAPKRHHRYGHPRHLRSKDGRSRIRHQGGLHGFPRSRPLVTVKSVGARTKGSLARRR
jgi:hypothetical protein